MTNSAGVPCNGDGYASTIHASYLPYGLDRDPAIDNNERYGFTDQEKDNGTGIVNNYGAGIETDKGTGLYNYDARLYDPMVGMFVSADSVVPDWTGPMSLNRYMYCRGNPVVYVDPSGHNTAFAGGAGIESETAFYSKAIVEKLSQRGVPFPVYVPICTSGKFENVLITLDKLGAAITSADYTHTITGKIFKASNDEGGQRNLIGYSMGSVMMAQTALIIAGKGIKVDNLILIGSPISSDSSLYKSLTNNINIGNVTRIDIPNDPISNGIDLLRLPFNLNNHFYFSKNNFGQQDELSNVIYNILYPQNNICPDFFKYKTIDNTPRFFNNGD